MPALPDKPAPVDVSDPEEARDEVQKALARLPAGEAGVAASAPLLAAYDPCVPCLIAPETSPDQPAHVAHPAQASEVPHA